MKTSQARALFEIASGLNGKSKEEKKQDRGIRKFKWSTLGCSSGPKNFSLDDLANVFISLGMTDNIYDARGVVFDLCGIKLNYGSRYLKIDPFRETNRSELMYRITSYCNG